MLQFWEVAQRVINSGSLMRMRDFNLKIFNVIPCQVKGYGIKYDLKIPIPSDDDLGKEGEPSGTRLGVRI